jgi:hypothetical protein
VEILAVGAELDVLEGFLLETRDHYSSRRSEVESLLSSALR